MIKVAEHSFLVPMRYSSLFSNYWQLGSQNWQDTSSAKKDYILICFIGLGQEPINGLLTRYYHGNTAGSKPENPVVRFFPSFVSRKPRKILAY